jgi:hypothetical protein
MSNPVFLRREFLTAASAAAFTGANATNLGGARPRAFSRLDIGPPKGRDVRAAVEARCVEEVCGELALDLPVSERRPLTVEQLRTTVLAHYPKARESALPPVYLWVWVNDHWVLWCLGTSTFEIELGRDERVLVTLEEWLPLS